MKIEHLHQLFQKSSGVCTDTRKISHNCIFFALKGENFNGNKFALEALKKGAAYAVVDENPDHSNVRLIKVDDVLDSLQQLATFHRKQLKAPIIALTGSNGKTTTKELIRAVLSTKYNTRATTGNLNNHIGVPLTLLSFDEKTEMGIVEMGANHQKEIQALCNIALPDYGLITNFGKAHLEGFGGIEGVIKGKSEMYDHLIANKKTVFFNSCDPIQKNKLKAYELTYAFGHCEATNYPTSMVSSAPYVVFKTKDSTISSQLTGSYNYNNLALAAAIGNYFKVAPEQIRSALESYLPKNNRSQLIKTENKEIVLDAYNANPSSMEAAIRHFAANTAKGSRLAILGDMFELGKEAGKEHQRINDLCDELQLEAVFLTGENFSKCQSKHPKFASYTDLENHILKHPVEQKHLLIKGSRGMALERLLDHLT
ncbi:UDP-N-acetylmuramoyl-tripeptide--D-alanyl-D-alanine ligase [Robertkochia sediminum]|uniref:UDP-N-acetylmuramoyl-tripeptide--D-alanyl-D- alanine ligase n=1 Tax=Robertkochia sediminum TaxID=2785326 RepID=UPI0019327A09|nr:UDP-N-acetylmuramoyl-tripeptide--D-alanyl-D-alanine ligase [Robertkochia sediminum]MBL7472863.1 UDP-N-acetylmuramoyl-tripeptide--D-alanyl-D-alanine ligase [Robertkochia sediminum]